MILTDRELATLLHALRCRQEQLAPLPYPPDGCLHQGDACDHFNDVPELTADEIDALCDRLNTSGDEPRLREALEAILNVPVSSNSYEPDDMGNGLDYIETVAKAALAGQPLPPPMPEPEDDDADDEDE